MEWTTPVSLTVRAGKLAFDNRHTIQRYWTLAKAYLDTGSTQIVITGMPGAGKSVLNAQMHGRARDLYFEEPGESTKVETDAVTLGQWTKLVRVLPGQAGYRSLGEIEAFQNNANLEGVIHVVDFGFSCPRDPVVAESLIKNDGLDSVLKLRERNLSLEVDALKLELANIRKLLAQHSSLKWLLIAVNKVDLYPSQKESALRHYHPDGDSAFGAALRSLQHDVGKDNLGIYIAGSCAYEADFKWNEAVAPSSLPRQEQDLILRDFMKSVAMITRIHE